MEPKKAFANRLAGKKEKTKKEMQNDRSKTMKVGERIEKMAFSTIRSKSNAISM